MATVGVTGASGFVGRHLCRALLSAGHDVRALSRSAEKARRVLPDDPRLQIIEGDVFDNAPVSQLFDGATEAVHLIGILRETRKGPSFKDAHVTATRRVLRAAERAGVNRYLHMSALGTSAQASTEYWRTKHAAEELVRGSRLRWTIFRPSLIHGPDGEFTLMLKGWAEGRRMPWLFMPYFTRFEPRQGGFGVVQPRVAPIAVGDVATAFVEALARDSAVGEVYNLSGGETLDFANMLRHVRDRLPQGKRDLRPIGVPGVVAAAQARVFGLLGLKDILPFDEGMAMMGMSDSTSSDDKAQTHLGVQPAKFRAAFNTYADAI